jgi:hypothetical protein
MTTEFGPLLQSALGQRVRFLAKVARFSTKRHWSGLTQATIVLENIRFEANGAQVLADPNFYSRRLGCGCIRATKLFSKDVGIPLKSTMAPSEN